MKNLKKLFALFLVLVLALSALPAESFAESGTINIYTAGEFLTFAEKCRSDDWSRGKTIVLKADIDLSGLDFSPVPSFSGSFEGGGHTISGVSISGTGSAVGGLFRYVQSGAVVRELKVSGVVSPSGNGEVFGGIAGENRGSITNCSFSGTVSGSASIGGIVGINAAGGTIYGCKTLGAVTGEHYTGGIAGQNHGSLIMCTNLAAVNTTNSEMELNFEELELDIENLNSTENVAAHTDTGGVAGFSRGIIQSCVNRGAVGYPHVGYNVGGVAGRQSGLMSSCRNFGAVNGRKDVGGIVGQMEPHVELSFSQNSIESLQSRLSALQQLIDSAITDVQGVSSELSETLQSAAGYISDAKDSASQIGDALVQFGGESLESINSFAAAVLRYIEDFDSVFAELEDFSEYLTRSISLLAESLGALNGDTAEIAALMEHISYAKDALGEAQLSVQSAKELSRQAIEGLLSALEDGTDAEELFAAASESFELLRSAAEALLSAKNSVEDAVENGLAPAIEAASGLVGGMDEITEPLHLAMEQLAAASGEMVRVVEEIRAWIAGLEAEEPLSLEAISEKFSESAGRLDASLAGLGGEVEKLTANIGGYAYILGEDLRQISSGFFAVMDEFLAIVESSAEGEQSFFEDVSEAELFTTEEGKVSDCVNYGTVEGDVNVGGVAGIVSVEYDIDPEEDISVSGGSGGAFRYLTKAVILSCENRDSVVSKKDCAGGVVGYMDLGVAYGCRNFGSVSASAGDYVGGVAGRSAGSIRNCWVLCRLSGGDYVGGVAGSGTEVSGCRSLVEIDSCSGFAGAVAGEALGEFADNLFVSSVLGGIDGISYGGAAESVSYRSLMALEDVPGEFSDFSLYFVAGNITVKEIPFTYGESIDPSLVPTVPEKAGHVGRWNESDFANLTFSRKIQAVYTPYLTVVASPDTIGERNIALAEGHFLPDAKLQLSKSEESRSGLSAVEGAVESWTVSLSGSVDDGFVLRCLVPEKTKNPQVWLFVNGQWVLSGSEQDGSYLLAPVSGSSVSYCIASPKTDNTPYIYAAAAALVLIALAVLFRRRAKKKTKKGTA